jgi:galactitol-specific phosphotransferase system IIC component
MSSSSSVRLAIAAAVLVSAATALAAEDLSALRVDGQRGQSADQQRRDRYECHNWAFEQTGETPVPPQEQHEQAADAKQEKRAERANRAIVGAVIGSVVGSLAQADHHHHDSGDAVLAGAAIGAGVGAATAGKPRGKDKVEAAPPQPSEYLRALTACLEGRGYTVTMPSPPTASTSR